MSNLVQLLEMLAAAAVFFLLCRYLNLRGGAAPVLTRRGVRSACPLRCRDDHPRGWRSSAPKFPIELLDPSRDRGFRDRGDCKDPNIGSTSRRT
jgi:hypothetical protein